MTTRKQFKDAKALIRKYGEECIAANPVKTGDIYKYEDKLLRVKVVFDDRDGKIFYRFSSPQEFEIVGKNIKFYDVSTDADIILKEGKKVKQIEGDELMKLKELNNFAYYDWDDIESKTKTERLKLEQKELLKKCCHDWREINKGLFSDEEAYECKVCDYEISTNPNKFN